MLHWRRKAALRAEPSKCSALVTRAFCYYEQQKREYDIEGTRLLLKRGEDCSELLRQSAADSAPLMQRDACKHPFFESLLYRAKCLFFGTQTRKLSFPSSFIYKIKPCLARTMVTIQFTDEQKP